ncbi:hemin receptor [Deinococcus sp. KSM4-11]|uniref:globin family protein n=1 Tax=Deinococcus sp. KSM4-11 TaxID=2568654 RepID=UPI0010A47C73|nr:globin family protein [Deinococcus sp. KSM4-11]THF87222.1 hemin receptor [Deinococcus sp. KSM4-11]
MNDIQIELIQRSFADIKPIAGPAAQLFYARLFELDPALRPLFRHDLDTQGHKLMTALGLVVGGLTRLDTLQPALRALGARHAGYGVRDEHYSTVGEALLWTLHRGLGEAFTPDVHDAWHAAYSVLAGVMMEASRTSGSPGPGSRTPEHGLR